MPNWNGRTGSPSSTPRPISCAWCRCRSRSATRSGHWRAVRTPKALILGTDGKLHVIDPASGRTIKTVAVAEPWTEPDDWQQPRPSVFARGHDVYVTDPATKQVHAVDVESGDVGTSTTLEKAPNELSGTVGHTH